MGTDVTAAKRVDNALRFRNAKMLLRGRPGTTSAEKLLTQPWLPAEPLLASEDTFRSFGDLCPT